MRSISELNEMPPAWEDEVFKPVARQSRKVEAAHTAAKSGSGPGIPADLSAQVLGKYVSEVKAEDGRNETGFKLAVQLRDNGFSEAEAGVLLNRYREQVTSLKDHPYSDTEVADTIKSVYSMPPRDPWAVAAPTLAPFLLPLDEYLSQDHSRPEDDADSLIGDGVIVRGSYNIHAGIGGVGKTSFDLQMALSLVTGTDFLGMSIPEPVPVAYLLAEGHSTLFAARLRAARVKFGEFRESFKIINKKVTPPEIGTLGFAEIASENQGAVIFLDTQGHFHSINDIDRAQWKQGVVKPLAELQRKYGVTFILLDHLNKIRATKNNQKPTHRELLTGAGNKRDDADTVLFLDWPNGESDPLRMLHFDKLKHSAPRPPLALEFDLQTGLFSVYEDGIAPVKENEHLKLVVEFVQQSVGTSPTGTVETAQVIEHFKRKGLSERTAEDAISKANKTKKILRVRKGHYRPVGE